MNIYYSREMYELAYSKNVSKREEQKVMEVIHKAAERGEFDTCFLVGDFTNHRLIMRWLEGLGYRCRHSFDKNSFYVMW